MAITKILHIGNNRQARTSYLRHSIDYITNPDKTDNKRYVGALNCQPSYAYEQMLETKNIFAKTDRRQAYHMIISFEEGEIDADTAFKFIGEFVNIYLSDKYEAIYSIHNDTDHIHGHIIFNSVNRLTGEKYRYEKGDWAKYIQPITNKLSRKYGLSTIEVTEEMKNTREKYDSWYEKSGRREVFSDMIARDIDQVIMTATDYENFLELLADRGYQVKIGSHLAIKPPGMKRFRRVDTLGRMYRPDEILRRISNESEKTYGYHADTKIMKVNIPYHLKRAKLSGIQRKYFRKLYETGKLRKRPYSRAWQYKDEIKKFEKLQKQYLFLAKYEIHSAEDLLKVRQDITDLRKNKRRQERKVSRRKDVHREAIDTYEEMRELIPAYKSYLAGDEFFKAEYEKYLRLGEVLSDAGYSYEGMESLISSYDNEISHLHNETIELGREIRICNELLDEAQTKEMIKTQIKEIPNKTR